MREPRAVLVELTPDQRRRVVLCGEKASEVMQKRLHEAGIRLPVAELSRILADNALGIVRLLPTLERKDDAGIELVGADIGEQLAKSVRVALARKPPPVMN